MELIRLLKVQFLLTKMKPLEKLKKINLFEILS